MPTVLIAEDDFIVADMLGDFLISHGYDVCGIARTVDEAVALGDLHQPDLGIFDFRLARGEHGSDIRPHLKDTSKLGILFVSGDSLENKMTKADADAYIQKPYGLNDLVQALHIIHAIKTGGDISTLPFPLSFHLFEDSSDERKYA